MAAFTASRKVSNPEVVCGNSVASTILRPGLAAFRARQYALTLPTKVVAPSPWSLAPMNRKSTLGPEMGANQESMVGTGRDRGDAAAGDGVVAALRKGTDRGLR